MIPPPLISTIGESKNHNSNFKIRDIMIYYIEHEYVLMIDHDQWNSMINRYIHHHQYVLNFLMSMDSYLNRTSDSLIQFNENYKPEIDALSFNQVIGFVNDGFESIRQSIVK